MRVLNSWSREGTAEDLAVDTMLLDGHILTPLNMDSEVPFFDSTGHYPILAGYKTGTMKPLYIAAVRHQQHSPWHFTLVKDGASSVKYTDEAGEKHEKSNFFVLALRHDPVDIPPPLYSNLRKGVEDPTGPVYWLNFWPRKSRLYLEGKAPRDDILLERFLDALQERRRKERNVMDLLSGFD